VFTCVEFKIRVALRTELLAGVAKRRRPANRHLDSIELLSPHPKITGISVSTQVGAPGTGLAARPALTDLEEKLFQGDPVVCTGQSTDSIRASFHAAR